MIMWIWCVNRQYLDMCMCLMKIIIETVSNIVPLQLGIIVIKTYRIGSVLYESNFGNQIMYDYGINYRWTLYKRHSKIILLTTANHCVTIIDYKYTFLDRTYFDLRTPNSQQVI